MNYDQTLDFLYQRLPMFSRVGERAYNGSLDNIWAICAFLNHPQHKLKTIHIAGTNGKGSVSNMLSAVLQKAGYKTGLYTSPHLSDFRERIQVNNALCEPSFIVAFTEKMRQQIDLLHPSFFELTVAMAFEYFVEQQVDIAIIETGLGGRLDSTNVVHPVLSIITNISYDHTAILGDSLAKIALEKAGIIKPYTPVVIGETSVETQAIFIEQAIIKNAAISFADTAFRIVRDELKNDYFEVEVDDIAQATVTHYQLDLMGGYQKKNLLTVLAALHQLQMAGWLITQPQIENGLSNVCRLTHFRGRWQIVQTHPYVVLDVAHNPSGIAEVVHQLKNYTYQQLHIIIGMVRDKEIDRVLALLPRSAIYYFTNAAIPRALPKEELKQKAFVANLHGSCFDNVNEALHQALNNSQPNDFILVCGSVFLVGELRF